MWSLNRTAGPNYPPWAMSYCYSGVFVMEHVCLAVILESGEAPLWCCWDLGLYLGLCLNRAWGIYSHFGTVSICTPLLCDLVIYQRSSSSVESWWVDAVLAHPLPPSEAKVYYFYLIYVKFCFPDASELDEDIFWYIMLTKKMHFY